jgi:tripartite-type tricarboxylate transporter receptor subunit TctC
MRPAATTILLVATAIAITVSAPAPAQQYPLRPVRLIVPNAVGSAPDIIARLIGQKLAESWGQQVLVDPRAGAGGMIGTELAARAAPDGYTLLMVTATVMNSTLMNPNVNYDMVRDFAPISLMVTTPNLFVVHPSVPARSIAELIALAKAHPGDLHFGSGGSGSAPHLCVEALAAMTGVRMTHVAYRGFTPALNDLVAGQIQFICAATPTLMPLIAAGKLRGLGVTTAKATALAPGFAPIADSVRGFEVQGWYGLFAPAGTPPELIARLNGDVVRALKSPQFQERFSGLGVEAVGSSPQELGALLKAELAKWGKIIKSTGARME